MQVTRLKLANVRAIRAVEFKFLPGCNLIVGVNGVGKTSVLDALAVSLSAVVRDANRLRASAQSFAVDDIRVGSNALELECGFSLEGQDFSYVIHKPRTSSAPQKKKAGSPREQVHRTPERSEYLGAQVQAVSPGGAEGRPIAVLFSTRRAVPSDREPSKKVAAGGIEAACAEAFTNRELRLGEFAAWMRVQQALRSEKPAARRVLGAFEETVRRFLPEYRNLRVAGRGPQNLMIDRGKTALEVRQLSDGERGVLAMVLDLTRRLAQANPHMKDPADTAEAVVMIDEIDLHLHPQWQRQVVRNLIAAFPKCQFIATTHSPQVIGEVQHDRIQIMSSEQVYSPTHSFGVDSSRVLEEIMASPPRSKPVQDILKRISNAVDVKDFARAQELLSELTSQVGENDPEVTRARGLLDFLGEEK